MRKKNILLSFTILGILGLLGVLWFTTHQYSQNEQVFSALKQSCVIAKDVPNEDGSTYQYINTTLGFSFSYPKDAIVCEQGIISPENSLGIMVWKKDDFLASIPVSGPIAIININNEIATQLSQPVIGDTTSIDIGGIKASSKQVRSSLCIKTTCKEVAFIEFQHRQDNYSIELYDVTFPLDKSIHWIE